MTALKNQSTYEGSLVDLLRSRAIDRPAQTGYMFLGEGGGEPASINYGELDRRSRSTAASLQECGAAGKPVLLLFPPGFDFIAAFFGCLYAGAIAVPTQLPPERPRRTHAFLRFKSVADDCRPAVVLTTQKMASAAGVLLEHIPSLKEARWIPIDSAQWGREDEWREPQVESDSLAFLQYTSGSTASPKGVMVSHENLIYNSAYINRGFRHSSESVGLTWLPHFHDMGLIDGVIQPVYMGFPCVLMSPLAFLQSPVRWLAAITEYKITHTGGPNFAYDLCVRKVTAEQKGMLDLRSWSVAYNGAEPVRAATLDAFARAFEECGFNKRAFYPAYGMAEATLKVTGGERQQGPVFCDVDSAALERHQVVEGSGRAADVSRLVASGKPAMGTTVLIVDPKSMTACDPDRVGEIWVSGPGVARGYWNKEAETRETFNARLKGSSDRSDYLRTGDLGFLKNGELFVTGRIKDLIIIRGLNHYPHDIELTAQRANAVLRAGGGAAFSVEVSGNERLVLVQEIDPRNQPDLSAIVNSTRRAIAVEHEIQVYAISLVRPGTVPKTTSGKLQRRAAREFFLSRELEPIYEWKEPDDAGEGLAIEAPVDGARDALAAAEWIRGILAKRLGIDPSLIGLDQPVIGYGLDSLGAVELIHGICESLGRTLPLSYILQAPTIGELGRRIAELKPDSERPAVEAGPREEGWFPLSPGQHSLWYLNQLAPTSAAYNITAAARIVGPTDIEALRVSFQSILERHSALSLVFSTESGDIRQRVNRQAGIAFTVHDAEGWDDERISQQLAGDAGFQFDLAHGPLFRVVLYKQAPDSHIMLLAAHHIVSDLWSMSIILAELGDSYGKRPGNAYPEVGAQEIEYADYVRWQQRVLDSEGESLWSYWKQQLDGAPQTIDLITDHTRPLVQTLKGASEHVLIDDETAAGLIQLCRNQAITLNVALMAAYALLLYRYTGQTDILIGTPVAGREQKELQQLAGYLVNPVVIRARIERGSSFEDLARAIRITVAEAVDHGLYPFPMLVRRLQATGDPSRSPVCQVFFAYQSTALLGNSEIGPFALGVQGGRIKVGGLSLESIGVPRGGAQFDLSIQAAQCGSAIGAVIEYSTDLFDSATISRIGANFTALISSIADNRNARISDLQFMAKGEMAQVLVDWNKTDHRYCECNSLAQTVEEQAESAPEAIALVFEEEHLSYGELEQASGKIATLLRNLGAGTETIVGISMDRSMGLVCGLLAIVRAGSAFLPLDPSDPEERRSFMMRDCGINVLISQKDGPTFSPGGHGHVVYLEEALQGLAGHNHAPRTNDTIADNAAYVIFTSGSTGKPKGVMNTHGAIINRLAWMQERYVLSAADTVLQKTTFTFDVSVWEFFWPLIAGARLVIARPEGHKDPDYIAEIIAEQRVTTIHFVPSMLKAFLEDGSRVISNSLRLVICSGEELSPELAKTVSARTSAGLHNLYGPTEAAIDVTAWQCTAEEDRPRVPIGYPISNIKVYALDDLYHPVPVGAAGELFISGAGLARCYVNQPAMTAERFAPDPFGDIPGRRAYRTGDLARYANHGELEYLGRIDGQVKVRGFRIELGEVESALKTHKDVADAVVTARKDSALGTCLAAYVVEKNGSDIAGHGAQDLRIHLRSVLPNYMVPAYFIRIEALPLTASGKVDRRALPTPDTIRPSLAEEYTAPASEFERAVSQIFAEVLSVDRVGINENFFDLGGHSLVAAQVLSRIRDTLGVEVPLRALFETPTVAGIAGFASRSTATTAGGATPITRIGRPAEEGLLSRLDQMSEEEVDAIWNDMSEETGRQR